MAAATKTIIGNLACRYVGQEKLTDFDTDTTVRAVVLQDLYEETLDTLLRRLPWNFAIKRVELVAATDPVFGWDDAYTLPADWLRVVSVHPHDSDRAVMEYRIEGNTIVCNSSRCWLRYVFQVTDVTLMPPDFRDALAWRLALGLARSRVDSTRSVAELRKEVRRSTSIAATADGMEDFAEPLAVGSWITARG